MKRLVRHWAVQAAAARLLGLYLAGVFATIRWRFEGIENLTDLVAGQPHVCAFWHERLPIMPMVLRTAFRLPGFRPRRMHVLVSRHRDGRFIGDVIRRFDADIVLGSSSRGGVASVRQMIGLLRQGDMITITPDGPRGPRRQAAPGVAQLAALAAVPVLPCAAQTSRRRELRSWDRMVIPLPFGRGALVYGKPIAVARDGWREALPLIEAGITAACDLADRLCEPRR